MRCGKAREHISLDLDGQLPPDRAVGLTEHLDECADCLRYREDLTLGRRLLAATEPQLSDNFEWRLQLKLNQTLAQAAAESLHPWQDRRADRAAWLRNFGAAAAVGMAAVLAVAMVMGPRPVPIPGGGEAAVPGLAVDAREAGNADRLDINRQTSPRWSPLGGGGQRTVSGGQGSFLGSQRPWLEQGFYSRSLDDVRERQRLRVENQQLRNRVIQFERQMRGLQSQLDTTVAPGLDLREDQEAP